MTNVNARGWNLVPRLSFKAAVAAALWAAAGAAGAVDPPHDPLPNSCQDCHVAHFAPLPNLQGVDCIACHNSQVFPGGTWAGADQANWPPTIGSSHSWSANLTNAGAGATPPTDPALLDAVPAGGTLSCGLCHDPHTQEFAPFDPTAPTTVYQAGRHFMRIASGASEMCLDCHSAWAQSTEASRTYTATARSHPVAFKDAAKTTPLTLAVAGTGNDATYAQTPHDSAIKASVASATTSTIDISNLKLATNALANFVVRFTSGSYKNVQARIASNTLTQLTLAVALPAAPAAATTFEIDRVGWLNDYDVTTNAGAIANQLQDTSKSWPTSATGGVNSPTSGAGTVTILATPAGNASDVGKTCTLSSNTATVLTLANGCLTTTPAGGTWAYRVNWKLGNVGRTTALGSTTSFVDTGKTLWQTNSIAGLQVRFLANNAVARVVSWNPATFAATFTPARASAVAAGEDYVLEPVQLNGFARTSSSSGSTTSVSVLGTPFVGQNLAGALVRFTRAGNVANQDVVTRITSNLSNSLTVTALPAAVSLGDAFEIDLDGNTTNNVGLGGTTPSFTTGTVVCQSCHGVHYADSNAGTYDDAPAAGDGKLLRRAAGDETCEGCHKTAVHSSVTTDSSHGSWGTGFTCTTCHQPHGTTNIYLVKQQIATPNSGTKWVTFRNTTGAAANSFATASGVTPGTGATQGTAVEVCNACHTQTVRATNAASTDWSLHYNGATCTGCHTHAGGFAGAESKGAVDCTNCHNYGMRVADAGRAGSYHHVMEAGLTLTGAQATSYPTNAAPVTDATTDKTCVQCHVDHNLFRPDMNTSVGANGRGNNLRTRIGGAPPAAANNVGVIAAPNDTSTYFGNYDYVNNAVGGICASCHTASQTRDVTNQKNAGDGSTSTAALPLASFAVSAHAYPVNGTITNGSFALTVACTKCHNSDPASAAYQSAPGGRRFALHTSPDRRLRAPLGQAALADDRGEEFCYRCHSNLGDAIGGTTKTASVNDWYGTVTTMTAGATGIWAQMQKGTAGAGAGSVATATTLYFKPSTQETPAAPAPVAGTSETGTTFATNTLYLRDSTQAVTEPASNAYILASTPYTTTTYRSRLMSPLLGATAETVTATTTSGTTAYDRVAQFHSPPVAYAFTWNAGATLALTLRLQELGGTTPANNNCFIRYAAYRWTAGDAQGAPTLVNVANNATEFPTTIGNQTINMTTSNAVTFAAGDKILVEVEVFKNAPTNSGTCTVAWGATATDASKLLLPAAADGTMPEFTFASPAFTGTTWVSRSMSPLAPTAANQSVGAAETSTVNTTQLWRRVSFVSPPVAAATTLAASSWTLNVWDNESSANANAFARYRVYRWNAANTQGPDIVAWRTHGTEMGTASAQQAIVTPAGAAVPLAVGDKIVVELEIETVGVTTAGAYTNVYTFGSTAQANVQLPSSVQFTYAVPAVPASGRHDVGTYAGRHKPNPIEETRAYIASTQHVECEDCHNPHAARAGLHTKGSGTLALVLSGAPGVGVTAWGANWAGVTTYNPSTTTAALPTATAEWQVCFKCHSSANANVATWGGTGAAAFTDLGLEFNPSNESYHPVIQALPATGNRQLAAAALTGGWTPGQVMNCSDCHGGDSTATSQGPHGSSVKWMLNPNTTGTKSYNWPYTTAAGNGGSTGTLLTGTGSTTAPTANFCLSCHVWGQGGPAHTQQGGSHSMACAGCHIRVPHGGKALRLLNGPNSPARYKSDGNGAGTVYMNGGSRPASGAMQATNCQAAGGCTEHAASGTLLGW